MSRGLRAALAALVLVAGCGGGASGNRTFSSRRVPFTFEYPAGLKRCGNFGGSIVVLGWCSSSPTFGITSTDYVSAGRYSPRAVSLARLDDTLGRLVPNAWKSVRRERHSGMAMVVARGERKAGYPYSGYFFPLVGQTWRIDCASSPSHLKGSQAACREAVGSVKPR